LRRYLGGSWTLLSSAQFVTADCAITSSVVKRLSMPQRDPGVYLEDIEHYVALAVRFIAGCSLDQYLADDKTRAAIERVLEMCGEAMNNLYKVAPDIASAIPHSRDIVGFRNILAHGYAELDHRKVYEIAVMHAPKLLAATQEKLKLFPDPSES
jgi:uncharacterized protein with HEPN domain